MLKKSSTAFLMTALLASVALPTIAVAPGVAAEEAAPAKAEMFRGYLGGAIERGEIDPPVDLETLLHTMMAIVHGMALNDLPSLGVPLDKL